MKILKSLIVAFLIAAPFVACEKDDSTPPFVFEGQWEGKIGNGSAIPSGQFALNIIPGGSIQRVNGSGAVSGTGTWQLVGNNFSATYTLNSGTTVQISGVVEKSISKLSGNWSNPSESGKWYVTKKNQ